MSQAHQPVSDPTALPVGDAGRWASPAVRWSLLGLFWGGAKWLVLAMGLGLLASVKLHAPNLLADSAWLSYGRLQPAFLAVFLYGFAVPVGMGVALWMLARLGRTAPALPGLVLAGAVCWHVGVLVGVVGILAGDSSGYRWLSLPGYAATVLLAGYLLMGVGALATFRNRTRSELYPSQWFLFAALFWFPWVFSTAVLLLEVSPARGVLPAVVDGWYGAQLTTVCLSFIGLAALFYWIPKLLGRPLHSQYHAMLAFWVLVCFSGWRGVNQSAPVPAWLPGVTTVFSVLCGVAWLAVAINLHRTLAGHYGECRRHGPLGWWVYAAVVYLVAMVLAVAGSLPSVARVTDLTLYGVGVEGLLLYGFVGTTLLLAVRSIVPQLVPQAFAAGWVGKVALGCWGLGAVLQGVPLLVGGVLQGTALNQPSLVFMDTLGPALMALRLSTLGDLLLVAGALAHAVWFGRGLWAACRAWWAPRWVEAVRVQPAEARR